MNQLLAITNALSDEGRVRTLAACFDGELCVCQITELLQLAPSTVSKHLSILKQAGLVETRKDGRWIYYRLPGEEATEPARMALSWLRDCISRDKRIIEDRKRLKQILCINPEELCLKQRTGSACCSSAPATRAGARWRKAGRANSKAK
jgi:DNA-binding transcriptional ArsR family regulator